MADRWIIETSAYTLELNASYWAEQYEVGGVDAGALRLGSERTDPARVGDGLRSPAPFILHGWEWSDAQNWSAIRAQVNQVSQAVVDAVTLYRITGGGSYEYAGIGGSPPAQVALLGPGVAEVRIDLWFGTRAISFTPLDPYG